MRKFIKNSIFVLSALFLFSLTGSKELYKSGIYKYRILNTEVSNVPAMDGAGGVEYNGLIHVVCGWPGTPTNTHFTTSDGITFTQLANAPFSSHTAPITVMSNKIFWFGSDIFASSANKKKVYSYNGTSWSLVTSDWGLGELVLTGYCLHTVGSTEYTYIALGGFGAAVSDGYNNHIYRTTDGVTYEDMGIVPVGLRNRQYPAMYSSGGNLYLAGGGSSANLETLYDDVWISTDDGVGPNWTQLAVHPEIKCFYANGAVWDNKMWYKMGDDATGNLFGTYYTEDWVTIKRMIYDAPEPRHATTLVPYSVNSGLYVLFGNLWSSTFKVVNIITQ